MQEVTSLENQPPDAAGMLAVYRPLSVDPETGEEPDAAGNIPSPSSTAWMSPRTATTPMRQALAGQGRHARLRLDTGHGSLWQWEEASAA